MNVQTKAELMQDAIDKLIEELDMEPKVFAVDNLGVNVTDFLAAKGVQFVIAWVPKPGAEGETQNEPPQ